VFLNKKKKKNRIKIMRIFNIKKINNYFVFL